MAFFRIIFFLLFFAPAMFFLSGCYDDAFLEAMQEEIDFIAPFDVVLSDADNRRTVYFNISDTGDITSERSGDDASYIDIPYARSFTESLNINSTSDDIIEDNITGLVWTKCSADGFKSMKSADDCTGSNSVEMTWNDAYTTCDTLDYADYDDWRLPSLSELSTLLDFTTSPYINLTFFPDTEVTQLPSPTVHEPAYWTSTSRIFLRSGSFDVTDYGWVVYFNGGPYNPWGKFQITNFLEKLQYDSGSGTTTPTLSFVRCVRGGTD